MWFFNLLAAEDTSPWPLLIVAVVMIGLMMYFSNRSQRKRQQEMQETLRAIKPGNKVKTIGGICGVVVEVNPEDNTFVLETGSDEAGKSYLRFDKQAIYQTDAGAKPAPVAEETPAAEEPVAEEPVAETAVEENAEPVEESVEEIAEETTDAE